MHSRLLLPWSMALWTLVALLSACNGSAPASTEFETLEAQANAHADAARALAVNMPCSEVGHCGRLYLQPTRGVCALPTLVTYSRVSATARQAEAETAAQNTAASQALPLQPGGLPPNVMCFAGFPDPPLACERGACVTGAVALP
ncbi:hypothetical protein [Sphaerotilus sp.]|jgi:hypothetical protein|uniref:hypothetical protein n=1 Tax=Sphaerotilus sp. TaxID=2093942 RepID=UPI0025FD8100|nr:hypothetical protein [Sphaerotilus sp.]